ncbi:alpha/beta fold hydrolase [Desulfocicer niacini]
MKRYILTPTIMLSGLLCWNVYTLLQPMSGSLVRYALWTFTPGATALKGSVDTDVTLHYVSYGKGPAIFLLHGGLSNRRIWFSQIPWLVATGLQVVLPDTRGHGNSGLGSQELTYRLLASDVIHVMDALNIDKTDVIGWSDGGNTALILARYWPQRVKRLVSISANFNPSGLTPEALEETHTRSTGLQYWFKRWWIGTGKQLRELEKRIKRMWRKFPLLESVDLQKITRPVLVIVGKKDLISTKHARQMASLLPHGLLKIISGGHATPVTHSREVNADIATFLELPPANEF